MILQSEYKALNYCLLALFAIIVLYPLVAIPLGYGLKSCTHPCPSCGVTRDFYTMLVYHKFDGLINENSKSFLAIMTAQVIMRVGLIISSVFNSTVCVVDILLSGLSLAFIYYLFHH